MKKIFISITLSLTIIFNIIICSVARKKNLSVTGYWLQYSDKVPGRAQSVMYIYREKNGTLSGKVAVPFFKTEKKHAVMPDISCAKTCGKGSSNGYTYNYTSMPASQVQGLKVIWGLTPEQQERKTAPVTYNSGSILDPVSGKVYSCKATLEKDENTLKATGYIFIPWFGRSQMWKRISDTTANTLISKCGLTSKGFYPYTDAEGNLKNKALWSFCSNVNP